MYLFDVTTSLIFFFSETVVLFLPLEPAIVPPLLVVSVPPPPLSLSLPCLFFFLVLISQPASDRRIIPLSMFKAEAMRMDRSCRFFVFKIAMVFLVQMDSLSFIISRDAILDYVSRV